MTFSTRYERVWEFDHISKSVCFVMGDLTFFFFLVSLSYTENIMILFLITDMAIVIFQKSISFNF